MGQVGDVVETLTCHLHFSGVQRLPQSLLSKVSVQIQPHPGPAVLGHKVPLICPKVYWLQRQLKGNSNE